MICVNGLAERMELYPRHRSILQTCTLVMVGTCGHGMAHTVERK